MYLPNDIIIYRYLQLKHINIEAEPKHHLTRILRRKKYLGILNKLKIIYMSESYKEDLVQF